MAISMFVKCEMTHNFLSNLRLHRGSTAVAVDDHTWYGGFSILATLSHSDKVNNVNSSVATYTNLYITHLIIITASYTNLVLIEETTS